MKYKGVLLVSEDLERTKRFYFEVFGARVICDYGANITLTGGISFQEKQSWLSFIEKEETELAFRGNDAELYFEEDDLDALIQKLQAMNIIWIHALKTHDRGQRGIRIYDLDGHTLEISETLPSVVTRFLQQGYSLEEVSQKTMISVGKIKRWIKDLA